MRKSFILASLCALYFNAGAQKDPQYQEDTKAYFHCRVYSMTDDKQKSIRHPYITVLLSRENDPKTVVAAALTNPIGEAIFKDVPIDLTRPYLFTVLLPNGNKRVFRSNVWANEKAKTIRGNLHVNICLNDLTLVDYYSAKNVELDSKSKLKFVEMLAKQCQATCEGTNFYINDYAYPIFVNNGTPLEQKGFDRLMRIITSTHVKYCSLVRLKQHNDYFAGAIDLMLTIGETPTVHQLDEQYALKEVKR